MSVIEDKTVPADHVAAESVSQAPLPRGIFNKWRWLLIANQEGLGQVVATMATTLAVFGIFMIQGILVARVLGPLGRGEFGTAMFFPRDILLYVGLLGGIEVVNRYASMKSIPADDLRRTAARLGMFSGVLTAVVGATLSVTVLLLVNGGAKAYLIPYCLLVCLFLPWEHMHLIVSGVDRGLEKFSRYNFNRLFFAATFPVMILVLFISGLYRVVGEYLLVVVCSLFVFSKLVGLLPTMRGIPFRLWLKQPGADQRVPTVGKLLKDGKPYAISLAATELFERLDILLILALASIEESGFYFVAVPAAALLIIVPNALGVFTFNAGAENKRVPVKMALGILASTIVFQVISTIVLAQIVPQLIVIFYGREFAPAIEFTWFLLPACAIRGFLQAADGYLKGVGKPLIGVVARFLSIFVMLAFVYFTFSKMGLICIPMAACVGQALSMLIITTFVIREVVQRASLPQPGNE